MRRSLLVLVLGSLLAASCASSQVQGKAAAGPPELRAFCVGVQEAIDEVSLQPTVESAIDAALLRSQEVPASVQPAVDQLQPFVERLAAAPPGELAVEAVALLADPGFLDALGQLIESVKDVCGFSPIPEGVLPPNLVEPQDGPGPPAG